jgi:secreted trypsin-like serine protease
MLFAKRFLFSTLFFTFVARAFCGVGCGRQAYGNDPNLPSNARIIGGSHAKRFSWPWMVSNQVNGGHFCGGTLIRVKDNVEASDVILTAAHCVGPTKLDDPNNYKGWTVTANLYWQSYTGDVETRNVIKAVHPSYTPIRNDVALLKLDKPIYFTDNIRPVCLPQQGEAIPVGKKCVAIGWGRNNTQDQYMSPDILQQTGAPARSAQYCQQQWGSVYVEQEMICAGSTDGSTNICNGDSGGPLLCRSDDGRWVQYGASSYVGGKGRCVEVGRPGVFARISNYVDWINREARRLTSL